MRVQRVERLLLATLLLKQAGLVKGLVQEYISSPLQCQPYSNQTGQQLYTPSIPDLYFNDSNTVRYRDTFVDVAQARKTYIYPGTSSKSSERNCSGTVVGIEFCYQATEADVLTEKSRRVVNILSFAQDGLNFIVNHTFSLNSMPSNSTCTQSSTRNAACCLKTTLSSEDQFPISPLHAVGVTALAGPRLLVIMGPSYVRPVEHFVTISDKSTLWPIGSSVAFDVRDIQSSSVLVLMRFIIDPSGESLLTSEGQTPETSEEGLATDPISTDDTGTPDAEPKTTDNGGLSEATMGGIIGAGIVLVLNITLVIVVMLVTLFVRRKRRVNRTAGSSGDGDLFYTTMQEDQNNRRITDSAQALTRPLHLEMQQMNVATTSITSGDHDENTSHYSVITSFEDDTPSENIEIETNSAYSIRIHEESTRHYSTSENGDTLYSTIEETPIQTAAEDNVENDEDYVIPSLN